VTRPHRLASVGLVHAAHPLHFVDSFTIEYTVRVVPASLPCPLVTAVSQDFLKLPASPMRISVLC